MLRKRARSTQKNQQMGHLATTDSGSESNLQSDNPGQKQKTSSLFGVPGLFVGLSPKGLSDCDAVRSPTSPLDLRMFSNLGNPNRSPRSPRHGFQKVWGWGCSKVGLSIVDSLDEDVKGSGKVIIRRSESKNILFGSQVRIKVPSFQVHTNSGEAPKSLPRNFAIFPHKLTKSSLQKGSSDVLFEIGEGPFDTEPFGKVRSCSLDGKSFSNLSRLSDRNSKLSSGNSCADDITPPQFIVGSSNSNNSSSRNLCHLAPTTMSVGSPNGIIGSLSASEIELSEDYTCVISHGPNPKKTHIYGDCVLECHSDDLISFGKKEAKEVGYPQVAPTSAIPSPFPSDDFLSFCYYCNKKLVEGEDIYMYRGEKAFCSLNCREQEIMIDEALEKASNKSSEDTPPNLDNACIMMIDAP